MLEYQNWANDGWDIVRDEQGQWDSLKPGRQKPDRGEQEWKSLSRIKELWRRPLLSIDDILASMALIGATNPEGKPTSNLISYDSQMTMGILYKTPRFKLSNLPARSRLFRLIGLVAASHLHTQLDLMREHNSGWTPID